MTSRSSKAADFAADIGGLIRAARREGFSVRVSDFSEEDEDYMLWILDVDAVEGEWNFVTFVPMGSGA